MKKNQYDLRVLGKDAAWDISIEFNDMLDAVLVEGFIIKENTETDSKERHVSSYAVSGQLSINGRLTGVYKSDFGDIEIIIDEYGDVYGSYTYDGYEGYIEGFFEGETMTIEGRYEESKDKTFIFIPLGKDIEEGDFLFQYKLEGGKITMQKSEYRADGTDNWKSWGIKL